jgi:hypothetical protein
LSLCHSATVPPCHRATLPQDKVDLALDPLYTNADAPRKFQGTLIRLRPCKG